MNSRISGGLAIVVTTIWALSMIMDAVAANYDPPGGIHGALMVVLGGIFGARIVGRDGA
jgi:hypothetical protein